NEGPESPRCGHLTSWNAAIPTKVRYAGCTRSMTVDGSMSGMGRSDIGCTIQHVNMLQSI
ncbi:MAG: hypothetical protein ACRBB0_25890, partial [Pelagimonas sp.]|uniref:hypothetical protein n=1 Tax=Pelagimonas sp. TaxID=2073170 RepID=UPI003D6AD7E1